MAISPGSGLRVLIFPISKLIFHLFGQSVTVVKQVGDQPVNDGRAYGYGVVQHLDSPTRHGFIRNWSKASRTECAADGLLAPCVFMDDRHNGEHLLLIQEVDKV